MSQMRVGPSSGMVIGSQASLAKEKVIRTFRSYITHSFGVLCFDEIEVQGNVFWDFPMVLETVLKKGLDGSPVKTQNLRPVVLFMGEKTRFKPLNAQRDFLCEIEDLELKRCYYEQVQKIKEEIAANKNS